MPVTGIFKLPGRKKKYWMVLSPIFVDDLCAKSKELVKPKTVNAKMYAEMIKVSVGPAVRAVYPAGDEIFPG